MTKPAGGTIILYMRIGDSLGFNGIYGLGVLNASGGFNGPGGVNAPGVLNASGGISARGVLNASGGVNGPGSFGYPGVTVDISPEAFAAARSMGVENPTECRTCAERRYQDVSDDSSVSFQSPTHISPGQSASAVAAHEAEHVSNEQARADREGRRIISQSVTLSTSICPECKTVYVSGGQTRTISAGEAETPAPEAGPEAAEA